MSKLSRPPLRDVLDRFSARLSTSMQGPAAQPVNAVAAGRALLAVSGFAILVFAPLLAPGRPTAWYSAAMIAAALAALLVLSIPIPWSRLPARSTLCFPLAVVAALATLGLSSPAGFAAPLTGTLTLCFAYVGLTQPPGTAVFGLPFAAATLLCAYGGVSGPVTVRLVIALCVWSLLGELLARLMRRQVSLSATLTGNAHRDELTGVPNRRDLQLRVTTTAPGDTLVMCDLDHFKKVNDTFGHSGGDRVLAEFGAMLRVALRQGDYCARYGGEEFLIILPEGSIGQARSLVMRLQDQWATLQPAITFSAGIATCTSGRSVTEPLAVADAMLYAAKTGGRNRVVTEPRPVVLAGLP